MTDLECIELQLAEIRPQLSNVDGHGLRVSFCPRWRWWVVEEWVPVSMRWWVVEEWVPVSMRWWVVEEWVPVSMRWWVVEEWVPVSMRCVETHKHLVFACWAPCDESSKCGSLPVAEDATWSSASGTSGSSPATLSASPSFSSEPFSSAFSLLAPLPFFPLSFPFFAESAPFFAFHETLT
jgi:hypothetical protein